MLEKIKSSLTWPVAAVVMAGGVCYTAIAIFAPHEAGMLREGLMGANGLLWTLVAAYRINTASQGA